MVMRVDNIDVWATSHGISESDGKFVIAISTMTDEPGVIIRIENCTMLSQRVKDFIESHMYNIGYNVKEWR